MNNDNLGLSIAQIFESKYVIPLYQRHFAWREDEITQLINDIYEQLNSDNKKNYYIGSLVVLKRHNGDYEVIDGQQRLTVLSLIQKIINNANISHVLSYDSRPEVENFFNIFYQGGNIDNLNDPSVYYLKEAVDCIKNKFELITEESFKKYFFDNVYLVRVEIPADTDVATYFEIMNNRGEQLQKHEIVKAQILSNIKGIEQQKEFAKIWDACSQIDIPIQKSFNAEDRKKYFGDNYDLFNEPKLEDSINTEAQKLFSIQDIIESQKNNDCDSPKEVIDDIEDEGKYKSILEWEDFLMHVFNVYVYSVYKRIGENIDIPLHEKFLLAKYKEIKGKIDPIEFIKILLFCRTVFDRFIVKVKISDNDDDLDWQLIKPKKYNNSLKYINTFGNEQYQKQLIKALSMLQVTFRQRHYKNYLQDILYFLYDEYINDKYIKKENIFDNNFAEKYLSYIHNWINKYYENNLNKNKIKEVLDNNNRTLSEGTQTPYFLFNFIDYLYWVDAQDQKEENSKFKDFKFQYWNSIEHHLAQNKAMGAGVDDMTLNCLGNLCLISKSSNSRLSDRDVKEKVQVYKDTNMGCNRQRIYAKTKKGDNDYSWTQEDINNHYSELVNLIKARKTILNLNNN